MISGVHLHLLVNHAPMFGAMFALGLLLVSYVYAPDPLRRVAMVVLIGTAIVSVVADLSGDPAEHAVSGLPGVKRALIHDHERMADFSYWVALLVGLIAIVALFKWRRTPIPQGITGLSLLGSLVVTVMMSWTALLGGRIRHTEVRQDATPAEAAAIEPRPQRSPGGPPQ